MNSIHFIRNLDVPVSAETLAEWHEKPGAFGRIQPPWEKAKIVKKAKATERTGTLDTALAALLQDLAAKGLLDSTLVVLATEFGRTPKINQNKGRDHYPRAFSGILAGGGIKGGQVYGKTDAGGMNVVENKVKVQDFNATIATALGLPIDQILHSPTGRPFQVAHKGKPVLDLF